MTLFDSHAHLTGEDPFLDPLEALLTRAKSAFVQKIININTTPKALLEGLALAEKHPFVFNAGATHPHDVETQGELQFSFFEKMAKEKKLVAIGETGLDYFYQHAKKTMQQTFLRRYLKLAKETNLPLIIHCREAFDDFFQILDEEERHLNTKLQGVLHCFTGTLQEAKEVLKRGWYISLSGIVTFKKSLALQEIAKEIPLNRLLIETDAPFLAPQSRRGKPNEPAFLQETALFIAQLKGVSFDVLAKTTFENTCKLFKA